MPSPREVQLYRYREQILQTLAQRGDPLSKSFRIALADLVPGIAFREIWPLASLFSPLRPYLRDKIANHDYIPRKRDMLTATWFARALAASGEVDHPTNLNIVYVGDSASDLTFGENIAKYSDINAEFSVSVTLYLFDRAGAEDVRISPNFRIVKLPTWTAIEESCLGELGKPDFRCDSFLLLDIDRTVLLPRGLCDPAFNKLNNTAISRFISWFSAHKPPAKSIIFDALESVKKFPPYDKSESQHFGDEDVRAIACLFLCANLIDTKHFGREQLRMLDWLPSSLKGLDPESWNVSRIANLVDDVRISSYYRDCTLAPYFREIEHEVMLEMADAGECYLNGHLVRLLAGAIDRSWTPVAYSDRPGASVGLTLRSYYRSRPTLQQALIQTELPVIFETYA